jgi:hypothetical protein
VICEILLLNKPIKSLRHAGRGIGHGNHRVIAGDVCQGLPAWAGEGIGVAHRVSPAEFTLNRDHVVAVHAQGTVFEGKFSLADFLVIGLQKFFIAPSKWHQ